MSEVWPGGSLTPKLTRGPHVQTHACQKMSAVARHLQRLVRPRTGQRPALSHPTPGAEDVRCRGGRGADRRCKPVRVCRWCLGLVPWPVVGLWRRPSRWSSVRGVRWLLCLPILGFSSRPQGLTAEFRRSRPRLPLGNLRRRYIHASQNRRACCRLEQVVRPILRFIARLEVNHPTATQLRNPKPLFAEPPPPGRIAWVPAGAESTPTVSAALGWSCS
jgi:hypothetical protein